MQMSRKGTYFKVNHEIGYFKIIYNPLGIIYNTFSRCVMAKMCLCSF